MENCEDTYSTIMIHMNKTKNGTRLYELCTLLFELAPGLTNFHWIASIELSIFA